MMQQQRKPQQPGGQAGQQQVEPMPGVCVGDELFFRHARGPASGRVVCHGKHGVTLNFGGQNVPVRWEHVLAHKSRAPQNYTIEEDGEDGMIVLSASGARHFIGIPPEAREDRLMVKSIGGGMRLVNLVPMAKAAPPGAGLPPGPGLVKKPITDKNGVQTSRWVSMRPDHIPQRGQHLGFKHGSGLHHGLVTAVGKHGVTLRDADNERHRVLHRDLTHHWEGGDAPGHSPDKMTGGKIKDEWVKFSKDSGSLGIPREKMPQFDEADTGELMEYLKGKGIEGRRASASPDDLKPTQAEYSSAKVDRIASGMFGKNERPIMVSSDGYVLDRHHQLMAARQNGEEKVPVIVFNKPIRELMAAVEQFPKAYKTEGSGGGTPATRRPGVPTHGPADQPGHGQPAKPDWAPREPGEADKAYAKRVIDKGDKVTALPEDHGRYFNTTGAETVPLDRLHSTKTAEENQQGGENGPKRMLAAYHGMLGKRDPITVRPHPTMPGHYEVTDGNGTLTSAQAMGWSSLPVKVDTAADVPNFFDDADLKDLPDPKVWRHDSFANYDDALAKAPETRTQLQSTLEDLAPKLGLEMAAFKPKALDDAKVDDDKAYVFMGPIKEREKSEAKVKNDYGGDWGRLKDLVRASIAVRSLDQIPALVDGLKSAGIKLAQRPKDNITKPTPMGYRDMNLVLMMPNGVPAELQIHLKSIMVAKAAGHDLYNDTIKIEQRMRAAGTPDMADWPDAERKEFGMLVKRQKELYASAFERALRGKNVSH